jgi:rhamnosyl/mannosyltransferase
VVWYHSEVIRSAWKYRLFYEPFLEFALHRAVRIVVASPPMCEVPALRAYRDKCTVVPFGLRVERYAEEVPGLRRTGARPTFLFVGRLVGYKGLDVLLEALPDLDAETVIIGDGPLRGALERMASDLGVRDRVRFLGEVTARQLLTWYQACDALVLPSITRQEAFGMVQLEAMLCGRPVISTDLATGVSWVNQDEHTGLVVKPGDVGELRQALMRLIEDPDLRQRLGAAARARVLSHFTAERMCSATRTLYQDVISRGSSATQAEPAAVA